MRYVFAWLRHFTISAAAAPPAGEVRSVSDVSVASRDPSSVSSRSRPAGRAGDSQMARCSSSHVRTGAIASGTAQERTRPSFEVAMRPASSSTERCRITSAARLDSVERRHRRRPLRQPRQDRPAVGSARAWTGGKVGAISLTIPQRRAGKGKVRHVAKCYRVRTALALALFPSGCATPLNLRTVSAGREAGLALEGPAKGCCVGIADFRPDQRAPPVSSICLASSTRSAST